MRHAIPFHLLVLTSIALLICTGSPRARAADGAPPRPVELWPNGAPGATGDSDEDKPAVSVYLPPPEHNTGAAVLVCPGGGFTTRCIDFEGVLVAEWLRSHGVAGVILRYRIRPLYTMKESLLDAQRGMQYVRGHASELRIDPNRVGIIGFSAGAELAASAAMRTLPGESNAADLLDRQPSRPDFLVLAYGSAPMPKSSGDSNAPRPSPPPTFMFCTAEDMSHLTGMLDLYASLRRARVPAEAHFFASGEHGVGFAQGDPDLGAWPDLMLNWLRGGGFLTGQPRVAVRGMAKLNGEPLARGSVILTPVDAGPGGGAPLAVGYVFNTGPTRGEFVVPADRGVVPGRYRVEVRQDATRWVSNSRDPIQLKMRDKMRAGTMTDEDRREWNEATRKRDLSPSIEGQRVYRRQHPKDAEEMTVEIKPGGENRIDVEVFSE